MGHVQNLILCVVYPCQYSKSISPPQIKKHYKIFQNVSLKRCPRRHELRMLSWGIEKRIRISAVCDDVQGDDGWGEELAVDYRRAIRDLQRAPGYNERAAAAAVVGYDRVVHTAAAAAAAYLLSAAVVAQQSHVAACLSVAPCQSNVASLLRFLNLFFFFRILQHGCGPARM